MERLETVVEQMENSKLPLEDLIRCYEEGTRLIKVCSERLTAAEQRIEMISRDAATGETRVVDYPPPTATLAAAPPPKSSREPKSVPDAPEPAPAASLNPSPRPAKTQNEVSLF